MHSISILFPTRGRVKSLERAINSFLETASHPDSVNFHLYVEDADYETQEFLRGVKQGVAWIVGPSNIPLTRRWNMCARDSHAQIFCLSGDDVICHTHGWDDMVRQEFENIDDKIALVFGRDGCHDGELAGTQFMHRRWYETVGYVLTEEFNVWFSDTWNDDVALRLGRRRYLPDLFIEHMSQDDGKAEMDETHRRQVAMRQDDTVEKWTALEGRRVDDVIKLRAVMQQEKDLEIHAAIITRIQDQQDLATALESIAYCVDSVNICLTDEKPITALAVPMYDVKPKFSHFPWKDSFAAARNASIEGIDSGWILYVDSDDVVMNASRMRHELKKVPPEVSAVAVKVRSEYSNGSFVENWQPRLFRAGLKFRGRIHEQLFDPEAPDRQLSMWGQHAVWINHVGYNCGEDIAAARRNRNLHLMTLDMDDDPFNFMVPFHFTKQELGVNNEMALEMAEKAFHLWQGACVNPDGVRNNKRLGALIWSNLAKAHLENGNARSVIALWERCPLDMRSAEFSFLLGSAQAQIQDWDASVAAFHAAWTDEGLLRDIGGDPEAWTWKPLEALASIYKALAENMKANRH